MSFLVDRFSPHQPAGVFGHSFGGAATATAIAKDVRIAGGVNLDGMQFGRVVQDGFGSNLVRRLLCCLARKGTTRPPPTWTLLGRNSNA